MSVVSLRFGSYLHEEGCRFVGVLGLEKVAGRAGLLSGLCGCCHRGGTLFPWFFSNNCEWLGGKLLRSGWNF